MKRLSEEQKKQLKDYGVHGLSLRKIRKITNLPLSTIQYTINKNKKRPRTQTAQNLLSDFLLGELLGAFAGDGSYYHCRNQRSMHHWIRFFLSYRDDKEYMEYLCRILENMGLNYNIYIRKHKGKPSALEIRVASINLYILIKKYLRWEGKKTYSVCLRQNLGCYSNELLFGFARGLMDTDGFTEAYSVACGSVSKQLIYNLHDILIKAKIKPHISVRRRSLKNDGRKDLYLVRVPKADLRTYYNYIGFSNPRKNEKLIKIMGLPRFELGFQGVLHYKNDPNLEG